MLLTDEDDILFLSLGRLPERTEAEDGAEENDSAEFIFCT